MASEGLFRLGIVSLIVVIALDVVVAWALYRCSVRSTGASRCWRRRCGSSTQAVFMVAIGELLGVLRLLSNDGNLAVFGADEVDAQAMLGITAFNDIWYVEPVLCSVFTYSSSATWPTDPATSPGCWVSCLSSPVSAMPPTAWVLCSPSGSWTAISSFTFLGEFLLALWLLIRARRIAVTASALEEQPITVTR